MSHLTQSSDPRIKRIRDQLYTPHGDNTTWAQEVEADLASLQSDLDRLIELESEPVELTVAGEQAVAADDDDDQIPFAPQAAAVNADGSNDRLVAEVQLLRQQLQHAHRWQRAGQAVREMLGGLSTAAAWLPGDYVGQKLEELSDWFDRSLRTER